MPQRLDRVTTRQRVFLEDHGFPLGVVVGDVPLQREGVTTIEFLAEHPWYVAGGTLSFGAENLFTYGYPNERVATEATAAREADWAEAVGPEGMQQLADVRSATSER